MVIVVFIRCASVDGSLKDGKRCLITGNDAIFVGCAVDENSKFMNRNGNDCQCLVLVSED